jgi:hypothetical protein
MDQDAGVNEDQLLLVAWNFVPYILIFVNCVTPK